MAAGIVLALRLTGALTDYCWSASWLMPLAVVALLIRSLWRALSDGR